MASQTQTSDRTKAEVRKPEGKRSGDDDVGMGGERKLSVEWHSGNRSPFASPITRVTPRKQLDHFRDQCSSDCDPFRAAFLKALMTPTDFNTLFRILSTFSTTILFSASMSRPLTLSMTLALRKPRLMASTT